MSLQITVNNPPVSEFTHSPLIPTKNDVINFIDKSVDMDGTIVRWTWDFDDGNISYIQNPSHKYAEKGTYHITLTVEDDDRDTDSSARTIVVEKEKKGTPGFEFAFFIIAIACLVLMKRKFLLKD